MNDIEKIKQIIEGALLAAGEPLSLNQLGGLFEDDEQPGHGALREALAALDADCENRAVELREVASGYRLQVRESLMDRIGRLWAGKSPKYSRAMLETLAIIAYRQPITRGEIEQIRGVAVSSNILRTLQERDWIKSVGHRDVPGRPELLGTTRDFLDYFNLKSLDELPTLAEIKDLDNLEPELELPDPESGTQAAGEEGNESAQTEEDTAQDAGPEQDGREDEHTPDEETGAGEYEEETGAAEENALPEEDGASEEEAPSGEDSPGSEAAAGPDEPEAEAAGEAEDIEDEDHVEDAGGWRRAGTGD